MLVSIGERSALVQIAGRANFTSSVDFVQGGVDLGKTQYIDAYQRGNFWKFVKTNSNYHVLLGNVSVLPEQTINVTASQGSVITNPFLPGKKVGTMDINAFDVKLQGFLSQFSQITPDNVARLEQAWAFDAGASNLQVTPIVVGGSMYLTAGSG